MSTTMRTGSAYLMLLALVPAGITAAATLDDADDSPKELSVAPLDHVVYPDSRPEWVTESFEDEAFRIVVVSGPADTEEESQEEIRLMQRVAVSALVSKIADSDGLFDFYPISDEQIENEHVIRSYSGEVQQGSETKFEHAVELAFSRSQREDIRQAWRNLEVRDRLGAMGVISISSVFLLVCGSGITGLLSRRAQRREAASEHQD